MIHIFKKALSDKVCDTIIDRFYTNKKTQDDIFEMCELEHDDPLHKGLQDHVCKLGDQYLDMFDKDRMTPKTKALENFKIKKYDPEKKHSFPWHIDATDKESSTRFLAFLFYLNDSEAGTRFNSATIKAEKGNCLCFPPMWMFPHEGLQPTDKPKYIMSTYYHFVSREECDLKR